MKNRVSFVSRAGQVFRVEVGPQGTFERFQFLGDIDIEERLVAYRTNAQGQAIDILGEAGFFRGVSLREFASGGKFWIRGIKPQSRGPKSRSTNGRLRFGSSQHGDATYDFNYFFPGKLDRKSVV